MKIDELIKSLGIAVQEAHNAISDKAVLQFFSQHFDMPQTGDNNVTYIPKLIEITLPGSSDGDNSRVLYVPTAVLASHKNLELNEVKINLDIDISEETDREVNADVKGCSNAEYTGSLEIVFKCADEAEGFARIETRLNSMIGN